MKLRNTAIAIGVGAATFAGLTLLKVEKQVVVNSTAVVLIGGLLLSSGRKRKKELGQGMLTGKELLAKVNELGDVSKSDLVRECGYVSTKDNGDERLNYTAFYDG
tara:strand:+ start:493 stop:807 length:315 start_codon:yes stop_codon:yes gene_type:complete